MHEAARRYVGKASVWVVSPRDALEIGAYDVNGNARDAFGKQVKWYGIDLRPGPNVDEVADASTWQTRRRFDLVLSTEALEHAVDPEAIVRTAHRVLRKSGYFVMTCASPLRRPHDNDGNHGVFPDHYRGISRMEMHKYLTAAGFRVVDLVDNQHDCDIYATARKI